MKTLRSIREIGDKGLLSLAIGGEESANYTVCGRVYLEIGSPSVGDILTDEQIYRIREYDEYYRAKKKALAILAYADNNRRNLSMKLSKAGFGRDLTDRVVSEMVELGYIDERRQLERLITVEANGKLRGPLRVIPSLVNKGYSSSDVRAVMHTLMESGEVDFRKNAKALLDKKLPTADPEERKKFLYKNGYKV
ncbi:MAG: RecX family transcriptional regulator [Clostridia bacterium]|nr:RecX family transcriptional regulator [Clostridia bacterium]